MDLSIQKTAFNLPLNLSNGKAPQQEKQFPIKVIKQGAPWMTCVQGQWGSSY